MNKWLQSSTDIEPYKKAAERMILRNEFGDFTNENLFSDASMSFKKTLFSIFLTNEILHDLSKASRPAQHDDVTVVELPLKQSALDLSFALINGATNMPVATIIADIHEEAPQCDDPITIHPFIRLAREMYVQPILTMLDDQHHEAFSRGVLERPPYSTYVKQACDNKQIVHAFMWAMNSAVVTHKAFRQFLCDSLSNMLNNSKYSPKFLLVEGSHAWTTGFCCDIGMTPLHLEPYSKKRVIESSEPLADKMSSQNGCLTKNTEGACCLLLGAF